MHRGGLTKYMPVYMSYIMYVTLIEMSWSTTSNAKLIRLMNKTVLVRVHNHRTTAVYVLGEREKYIEKET